MPGHYDRDKPSELIKKLKKKRKRKKEMERGATIPTWVDNTPPGGA